MSVYATIICQINVKFYISSCYSTGFVKVVLFQNSILICKYYESEAGEIKDKTVK
jgi:hypothetical protein